MAELYVVWSSSLALVCNRIWVNGLCRFTIQVLAISFKVTGFPCRPNAIPVNFPPMNTFLFIKTFSKYKGPGL